ncbi:hypothetical protein [Psychromicrobium xiongbiense]|uniref:hypothetical protein n=1 Tax=Psychromicrobium xiongbiense TaxID=3051184 RepID=UPI002553C658|nr:hypothetical protein [Psychromicrobium sp. YIM S02556]
MYAFTNNGPTSQTVGAGYVAQRAQIFDAGGSLTTEGATTYNSYDIGPNQYWSADISIDAYGTWYSWGVVYGWNGGGHDAWYTFRTPDQSS